MIAQRMPTLAQYARMRRADLADRVPHGARTRILAAHPDESFEADWLEWVGALIEAGADMPAIQRRLLTREQRLVVEAAEWVRYHARGR